jgi:acetylornithine deacetylase/succinyl-diaminopimelate desuccinylase-like protein
MVLNGDGGGGVIGEDGRAQYYGLQAGEKSYADFEITLTSPGGHSSMPTPDNPIYRLAAALRKIEAYQFPAQSNELTQAALAAAGKKLGGELGAAMLRYAANPKDQAAADIVSRQPEYVGQVRTTCVATMANAGHAPNALPQRANANINCRIFPGVSIESVRETLAQVVGDNSATIKTLDDPVASDASPLRKDVMQAVTKAVRARYPGLPVVPSMSAGATDSLHFRAIGVPSYGVASLFTKVSDSFAHGLNERAPTGTIAGALGQWYSVVKDLSR